MNYCHSEERSDEESVAHIKGCGFFTSFRTTILDSIIKGDLIINIPAIS